MDVLLAVLPLLWLIVGLAILKVPAWKACLIAAIISFIVAVVPFGKESGIMLSGALEGVALAIWPILLVITSAIFTYNLVVHTKAMETIKTILTSVSSDMRILSLLLAWGFGAFMEGMAGFGTAVAIPAAMMVGLPSAEIYLGLFGCQFRSDDVWFYRHSDNNIGFLDWFGFRTFRSVHCDSVVHFEHGQPVLRCHDYGRRSESTERRIYSDFDFRLGIVFTGIRYQHGNGTGIVRYRSVHHHHGCDCCMC